MTTPDNLLLRQRLPEEFRWLEAQVPRTTWPALELHPSAQHWLEVHAWFLGTQKALADMGTGWLEGTLDTPTLHRLMLPRLGDFLGHLETHHHIESDAYFPAFIAAEPRIRPGLELLNRDHETIDAMLAELDLTARGLHAAITSGAGDPRDAAETLVNTVERTLQPVARHLFDEEEIVIPLLTLRGDPLGARE